MGGGHWRNSFTAAAIFAVLCVCGHNLRKILAHLRAWLAQIIAAVLDLSRAMLDHRHGYTSA